MIKVGQEVRFNPNYGINCSGSASVNNFVTGTVVFVHPAHRYFTTEYEAGGSKFKMSFNFNDLTGAHRNVFL